MYQSVNFNDFVNAFRAHDRENQFSYEAKRMIFDYIEEYEIESGEHVELDVIAICCDFSEGTAEQIANDYNIEIDEENPETSFMQVIDYLSYNSTVCGYDEEKNIIVYQSF